MTDYYFLMIRNGIYEYKQYTRHFNQVGETETPFAAWVDLNNNMAEECYLENGSVSPALAIHALKISEMAVS